MTKYQQIFYDIKHTSDYTTIGRNVDFKVFVDHESKEVILQWEESRQKTDWLLNLLFIPCPLLLEKHVVWTTLGYAIAYSSCDNIPMNIFCAMSSFRNDYKTRIQGWSFGSAMAKIAARHFYIRKKIPVDMELTYGDVKVWLNPFVHWLSKRWAKVRLNFAYANDLVTWCVPLFRRDNKCKVGGKLNIKKLFSTEYNHTHYEEYDYSEYEQEE